MSTARRAPLVPGSHPQRPARTLTHPLLLSRARRPSRITRSRRRSAPPRESGAIGTHDLGGKKVTGGAGGSAAPAAAAAAPKKGVANVHGFGGGAGAGAGATSNTEHAMPTVSRGGVGGGNSNVHGFDTSSGAAGEGQKAMATTAKNVGRANVHGFAGTGAGNTTAAHHNHEDSFQRRKGVVNTVSGAKDTTRAPKEEELRLPPKGQRKAQIMGIDMLDAHTAEGKARREGAEKRAAAGGNAYKNTLVHVSGGGGRVATLDNPKGKSGAEGRPTPADVFRAKMAKVEALNAPAARSSMGGTSGGGASSAHFAGGGGKLGGGGGGGGAPAPAPPPRPRVSAAEDGKENGAATGGSTLGGGGGGGAKATGGSAADVRAARAAHFEAMLAQQAAKRAAGAALLNE